MPGDVEPVSHKLRLNPRGSATVAREPRLDRGAFAPRPIHPDGSSHHCVQRTLTIPRIVPDSTATKWNASARGLVPGARAAWIPAALLQAERHLPRGVVRLDAPPSAVYERASTCKNVSSSTWKKLMVSSFIRSVFAHLGTDLLLQQAHDPSGRDSRGSESGTHVRAPKPRKSLCLRFRYRRTLLRAYTR